VSPSLSRWLACKELVSRSATKSSFGSSSLQERELTHSGAGPIGLVTLLACRAAGAAPIVITDLFQSRLDFAKKLVPNVRTLCIEKSWSEKETSERIKEAAGGPIKIAMECTGFNSSIRGAIFVSHSS
jgi:threonine dehydrogenase-like Zn-dependent dehydrogenase